MFSLPAENRAREMCEFVNSAKMNAYWYAWLEIVFMGCERAIALVAADVVVTAISAATTTNKPKQTLSGSSAELCQRFTFTYVINM